MPGLLEPLALPIAPVVEAGFTVTNQKVLLDIDLSSRKLKGSMEIALTPHAADSRVIRLNCRQARITRLSANIGKVTPTTVYNDPYLRTKLPWHADVHAWSMLYERIENQLEGSPDPELVVNLPKNIRFKEVDPSAVLDRMEELAPLNTKNVAEQGSPYQSITLFIEFVIDTIRDGLLFVGCDPDDLQYPHVYTSRSSPNSSSCLFPCVDSINTRCTWDLSIRTPRTIGDAFKSVNSIDTTQDARFSEEDKSLDMIVVCSGDMTDEIVDPEDATRKTTSFRCESALTAQHVGFAIGPFEYVNLASFRDSEEDEKLGKKATPVHGFCLPGRVEEVRNTCFPLAKALDFFLLNYGDYPFSSYKTCFVDDMVINCSHTASLTLCSSRLLFPQNIIEPLHTVTRQLIHAIACQWVGVSIVPEAPEDTWVVVGLAYYLADIFMKKLFGNNEYRYQQKRATERVYQIDVARPSIYDTGRYVDLDPAELEFISAKAPLVLFILDRRLAKLNTSSGIDRVLSKLFLNHKVGELPNGALSTAAFSKICERVGHIKLETFFAQWVYGAGCPLFQVTARFNKKRLVVEMVIDQLQHRLPQEQNLQKDTFIRDVREDHKNVFAGPVQPIFTGPMTIRIHEADGTPYEHIVEIKEEKMRLEIPYNTKYKRLKRSRRQKERLAAGVPGQAIEFSGDNGDDVLLYCLGDVLQTEADMQAWQLAEWEKKDEDDMGSESYEWIRMDADFEWICRMHTNMPDYMYVSQLQQDRDVVAQYESLTYFATPRLYKPVYSTILVRTLMDCRYFHGIRTSAASVLGLLAKDETGWVDQRHLEKAFQELFCLPNSRMTRPNDFSDRASYNIRLAIVRAMGRIRDNNKMAPLSVRKFLFEKLRYNDNSSNEFSDCHYIQTLMKALAETLSATPPLSSENSDPSDNPSFFRSCVEEIDRQRRLDEWLPSYQNVLSVAGLEAKRLLMGSGRLPKDPTEFLPYTQVGTYNDLRIAAFDSLLDLGFFDNDDILRWFLFSLSIDPSPYYRWHLFRLLGRTLASIAIGDAVSSMQAAHASEDTLEIQAEGTTDAREADRIRKQTVGGALVALKAEISSREVLKVALWDAVCSPALTIHELGSLLQICSFLYEEEHRMLLTLRYPRYWKIESLGPSVTVENKPSHVLRFTETKRVRTKQVTRYRPSQTQAKPATHTVHGRPRDGASYLPTPVRQSSKHVKRSTLPGLSGNRLATSPPSPVGQPTEGKQKLTLKLKLGSMNGGGGPTNAGAQTPKPMILKLTTPKPQTPR